MDAVTIIRATRQWLETVVVNLDLCPFAGRELMADKVRFMVSKTDSEEGLLAALHEELAFLENVASVETTLLIHPEVLHEFADYNQFLDVVDALLEDLKLTGVYQVASFHPDYQFADTQPGDAENYTNRSPFPMLHILREASVERAIAACPDTDRIPQRNIERLNTLGADKLSAMLTDCTKFASGEFEEEPAG